MTDIGSIIPDTSQVPVAPDLVHPQQAQNGSVSGHLPTDSSGQSETFDAKADAQSGGGQAKQPAKPKAGAVSTILTAPIKGPRNGIHWGAGVQSSLLAVLCAPSSAALSQIGMSQRAVGTTCVHAVSLHGCNTVGHILADRVRLAAEKGKSNFAHPLGVKPKHRKIVRTFGQVLLRLARTAASFVAHVAMMSCSACLVSKLTVWVGCATMPERHCSVHQAYV